MLISRPRQAQTTAKMTAAIRTGSEPAWRGAARCGISEQTVWKWRNRDSVHDRSHGAHGLQTTLAPAQEAVAVALRKSLLLPLDDLLAVVREFLNRNVSRSGLFGLRRRAAAGNHDFDRLCADLGMAHRLAPPMHPQTDGMVERVNGRIEEVLQSHRFRSGSIRPVSRRLTCSIGSPSSMARVRRCG
jgi:transposase InsO family protein